MIRSLSMPLARTAEHTTSNLCGLVACQLNLNKAEASVFLQVYPLFISGGPNASATRVSDQACVTRACVRFFEEVSEAVSARFCEEAPDEIFARFCADAEVASRSTLGDDLRAPGPRLRKKAAGL